MLPNRVFKTLCIANVPGQKTCAELHKQLVTGNIAVSS